MKLASFKIALQNVANIYRKTSAFLYADECTIYIKGTETLPTQFIIIHASLYYDLEKRDAEVYP